ncbi:hypothetical protein [Neorhizobium galegae]|uniref:Uncharacterized protein n=1 Tax=Neorhizobium galegae bv. orientalis str. HAMBI 540 TaxID=1028800 RepID=A0A068SNW7_NEOGA|nr:hypothetical protein [Neorhizobium galegae]MCQ1855982.1 hypothetical protein [Neorhizobium galegae]CDN47549.1 Hypothetical protein RG540_CH13690 [Neorhizobium galegae bv. orientalis str. HAMBI 540]
MNQQQVKYTMARIDTIEKRKLEDLKKACTVPAKAISDEELQRLLMEGKLPAKTEIKRDRYHTVAVSDLFDVSEYINFEHVNDDYLPGVEAIKAEANRVRDEVMLGDNAVALALLRAFAGE